MNAGRRSISHAEEVVLVAQVNSACPECGKPLSYKKGRRAYKHYEIAHIYPLNPTEEEATLLNGEERLSGDVNDIDNLIPLCLDCHGKFDKPRTVEEYRSLMLKKKEILALAERRRLQHEYQLQDEIGIVVKALDEAEFSLTGAELAFDVKPIEEKFDATMPPQVRRSIHYNVRDYFVSVRQRFQALDREEPGTAALISIQVKAFYLAQKQKGWSQQEIFAGVVEWIAKKAPPNKNEAAEIVASFFVQNCEVFE